MLGWRLFDIALLAFAFAHGMNGLRTVLRDYVHGDRGRKTIDIVVFLGWLVISAIGAVAIVAFNPSAV
jgi:succinate dehydrogenase / fumarate reductase membrane anchor subunit